MLLAVGVDCAISSCMFVYKKGHDFGTAARIWGSQAFKHTHKLMSQIYTQSRHQMRVVRFGLLQQGVHFATTCLCEAHHTLPFVVCGVAALDPIGISHAAHQLGRLTGA